MRAFLVQMDGWFRRHGWSPAVALAYAALVGLFFWTLAQFYIPGKGFSYLIAFGATQENIRISKVRRLDRHVQRGSDGYDAQFYVQIAMDPSLRNRELHKAMDSLPYRGRRILFAATAYAMGLGRPEWILQAFAVQNALAWLLLAGLLLHWFPPRDWDCFVRWSGVLFCSGVCVSVGNALFDGPSLLLIAFGVFLLEKGRPWWSTVVLALGGLGKETNLLGAAALLPRWSDGRQAWVRAGLRGLLVAAPLALWLVYISVVAGPALDLGARNFGLPLVSYVHKWREVFAGLPDMIWPDMGPLWSLLMLIALTVQFLFLVLRPRWEQAWWRVGASFAVLMIVLGDAVWEGYPGAASRVLLPMQLAFNVLVPAGRGWRVLLLLGNLTLLAAPTVLQSPQGDGYLVTGPDELVYGTGGEMLQVEYSDAWYPTERFHQDYWCWAAESGYLLVKNPHDRPLAGRLRFSINVSGNREVLMKINGTPAWGGYLTENAQVSVVLNDVVLPPGTTRIDLATDTEGKQVGDDPRVLVFRLTDLRIDLQRLEPEKAGK